MDSFNTYSVRCVRSSLVFLHKILWQNVIFYAGGEHLKDPHHCFEENHFSGGLCSDCAYTPNDGKVKTEWSQICVNLAIKNHRLCPASRRSKNWLPGRCLDDQFRWSTNKSPQMASPGGEYAVLPVMVVSVTADDFSISKASSNGWACRICVCVILEVCFACERSVQLVNSSW